MSAVSDADKLMHATLFLRLRRAQAWAGLDLQAWEGLARRAWEGRRRPAWGAPAGQ